MNPQHRESCERHHYGVSNNVIFSEIENLPTKGSCLVYYATITCNDEMYIAKLQICCCKSNFKKHLYQSKTTILKVH